MVLLGEYLCSRNEMRDIPLYTPLSVLNASPTQQASRERDREKKTEMTARGSPVRRAVSPLRRAVTGADNA